MESDWCLVSIILYNYTYSIKYAQKMLILPLMVYKLHMRTDTTKSLIALCMMRRLIMTHNLAPGEGH